jgi:hypothetical protein
MKMSERSSHGRCIAPECLASVEPLPSNRSIQLVALHDEFPFVDVGVTKQVRRAYPAAEIDGAGLLRPVQRRVCRERAGQRIGERSEREYSM